MIRKDHKKREKKSQTKKYRRVKLNEKDWSGKEEKERKLE